MRRFPVRIELSSGSVAGVGMLARVASVLPTGITCSARFVPCRQITGTAHIFTPGLNTMPTERFFTGIASHTQSARFAWGHPWGHLALHAEGALRLIGHGIAHLFQTLFPQDSLEPFLFGNSCVPILGNCSCRCPLHDVGSYAHCSRVRIEEWYFSRRLLCNRHRTQGQCKKCEQNGSNVTLSMKGHCTKTG